MSVHLEFEGNVEEFAIGWTQNLPQNLSVWPNADKIFKKKMF